MKRMFALIALMFASISNAQNIYYCSALCGYQVTTDEERATQGIGFKLVQASSTVDAKTAFDKLKAKCTTNNNKLFIGFSAINQKFSNSIYEMPMVRSHYVGETVTADNTCINLTE